MATELARLPEVSSIGVVRLPLLVIVNDDSMVPDRFVNVRLPVAETLLSDMLLIDVRDTIALEDVMNDSESMFEVSLGAVLPNVDSVRGTLVPGTGEPGVLAVTAPFAAEVKIDSVGNIVSVNTMLEDTVITVTSSDVVLIGGITA